MRSAPVGEALSLLRELRAVTSEPTGIGSRAGVIACVEGGQWQHAALRELGELLAVVVHRRRRLDHALLGER